MKKYIDKQYFIGLAVMFVVVFFACEVFQSMAQVGSIWFSIIYSSITSPIGAFMARIMSEQ